LFFMSSPPLTSTLFPYTTLFRSAVSPWLRDDQGGRGEDVAFASRRSERQPRGAHVLDLASQAADHDVDAAILRGAGGPAEMRAQDRKSTRLNSSHVAISYAVFCL